VTNAARDVTYEEGKDYVLDEAGGRITLPKGSRIAFKTKDELYPLMSAKGPKIGGKRGEPGRGILFSEGAFYHGMQVEATYRCAPGQWTGYVPKFAGDVLPRTLMKLNAKEPIKMLLLGDSISEGYNASKFTKAKPAAPPYGQLVAKGLEKQYGSQVAFENYAHAGWQSRGGWDQAKREKLGAKKPDLVVIAFGMNDVGYRNAAAFQQNIKGIMETIRRDSPATEFILVAPMLGNPQWSLAMEQFPLYRDALKPLCGPGVALADMTSIWQELLKRKTFYDLTGNGVNHPNDFGHRLYAQTILALLVPSPVPAAAEILKRIQELGGRATLDPANQTIVRLQLSGTKTTDQDLVTLGGLADLVELSLAKTRITDAGLPHLIGLKKLEALHLADNPITDEGVAAVKDMTQLQLLGLKGTQVGDAGLVHLARLKNLQWLGLRNTKVTDAGLAQLKNLPQLPGVSLSYCKVTDAGLAQLSRLTQMRRLVIDHTGITDAGLAQLKGMAELHTLDLSNTAVGDTGLEQLQGLSKLQMLELIGTKVTDAGMANLSKLARLQTPDKQQNKPIVEGAAPPQGLPQLPGIALGETAIGDAGLAHLKDLLGMQRLDLSKTQITDAGLAHLQALADLRVLSLRETPITDAGLKSLHGLSKLQNVDVRGTKITPAGVQALQKSVPGVKVLDR
ncbi:MAG: hypothetical protein K8T25_14890, partial [Planctomycetia bacterium]|nr:hypothetical protein [Planctomycetia bacterium]